VGTPVRQLILDNVDTVLNTISIAGGYKTDVTTVARTLVSWGDIGAAQMPWVGFAPVGQSSVEYKPNHMLHVRLPITIVGHVSARSGAAKTQALAKLEDDIIAVINADTTRDGNAIRTNWQGTQTDEGNADSDDHRGGSGTLVMAFDVLYQRTVNST
tara:strand:- start:2421 stop:2891 length:471 start_codon:yes stop_codon:yes gene_type:complete